MLLFSFSCMLVFQTLQLSCFPPSLCDRTIIPALFSFPIGTLAAGLAAASHLMQNRQASQSSSTPSPFYSASSSSGPRASSRDPARAAAAFHTKAPSVDVCSPHYRQPFHVGAFVFAMFKPHKDAPYTAPFADYGRISRDEGRLLASLDVSFTGGAAWGLRSASIDHLSFALLSSCTHTALESTPPSKVSACKWQSSDRSFGLCVDCAHRTHAQVLSHSSFVPHVCFAASFPPDDRHCSSSTQAAVASWSLARCDGQTDRQSAERGISAHAPKRDVWPLQREGQSDTMSEHTRA